MTLDALKSVKLRKSRKKVRGVASRGAGRCMYGGVAVQ